MVAGFIAGFVVGSGFVVLVVVVALKICTFVFEGSHMFR